jgi:hypothetical protein
MTYDILKLSAEYQQKKDNQRIWRKLLEHRKKFMKLAAKQFIKDNPNYTYSLIDD